MQVGILKSGPNGMMGLTLLAAVMLSGGCLSQHIHQWGSVDQAVAVLHPTKGNQVRGHVLFMQLQDGVKVVANLSGLKPGSTHAIHVHEFGDCREPDASSAGGHYNPDGHPHGLPPNRPRHAGDLGQFKADPKGMARYAITVKNISVAEMDNAVIGRAVIVHAKGDSGEGPSGNAGPRIACGVIGVANSSIQSKK